MRSADPVGLNEIPENVKYIRRTDLSHPTLEKTKDLFLQDETENCKLFFGKWIMDACSLVLAPRWDLLGY